MTFTLTFDKPMNFSTLGTADFENGSSAGITVNSVSATANPAVFTVLVTATSHGTLNFRIKVGAVIQDLADFTLDTSSALTDDTTIPVVPASRWWDGGTADLTGNGNAASAGGAGAWDTTIKNWDQGTGALYAGWNNGTAAIAAFAGTASTVTQAADITASGLRFDTTGYSITGSNIITLSSPATVTVNVNSAANATVSSVIAGTHGLTKTGVGRLTLTGNNTFTGGLNIHAGTVIYDSVSNANIWGAAGNVITFTGNATLLNNNNAYTLARGIAINRGITGTMLGAFAETTNVTGVVSGSGTMAVSGLSTGWALTLSNPANTFNGPISVTNDQIPNGGTSLTVASLGDAAGAGSISLGNSSSNSVFTFSGATSPLLLDDRQFIMTSTTGGSSINSSSSGNNTLTISTPLSVTGVGAKALTLGGSNTGANTFTGNIVNGSGTIALTKADAGSWTLTGASTYTGKTSVNAGTLSFNSIGNGGTASALGIPSSIANGTIAIGSGTTTAATLRYIGTGHTSARAINLAATTTGGGILEQAGTGLLNFIGDVTNSGTAKTLTLQGSTAGTGELSGIISNGTGPLAITKSGTGTWVLSGANSHLGITTVSAGKLFINGNSTAATGATNVSANATLGGTGTLGGNTSIAANGRLEFNLSTNAASHDKLEFAATTTLAFSGASTLTITSSSGASPGTYTLLTAPGGITGNAPATLVLPANWLATVTKSGDNKNLLLNVTSTGVVDPYASWSGGAAFHLDANNDGVDNGMAWLLGAANPSENALGKLPKASLNGANLRLTFRCLKSTGRGGVALKVQSSNDLGLTDPWTSHEAVVPDADSTVNGMIFDTTADADPAYINVIADIPAAGSGLFARLSAVVSP